MGLIYRFLGLGKELSDINNDKGGTHLQYKNKEHNDGGSASVGMDFASIKKYIDMLPYEVKSVDMIAGGFDYYDHMHANIVLTSHDGGYYVKDESSLLNATEIQKRPFDRNKCIIYFADEFISQKYGVNHALLSDGNIAAIAEKSDLVINGQLSPYIREHYIQKKG